MSKRGRPVSRESIDKRERILKLYNGDEPMSLEEIGQAVGVSKAYVSRVLRGEGVKPEEERPDYSAQIERIRELSGLSDAKIAELMGIRYELINRWAKGISPDPRYQRRITLLLHALEHAQALLK
jgi:transcriptional regulator with XRE-family HTH domain